MIYSSAAGTELAKRTVAAPEVAASQRGGGLLLETAMSEMRQHHVSSLSHEGERGTYGGTGWDCLGRAQAHLTHASSGFCKQNWLAAWAGGYTSI